MHIRKLFSWSASLGAAVAAFAAIPSIALAYPLPPATGQLTSGCTTVADGASCTFTFRFLDSTGAGDDGLTVVFGVHTVPGCTTVNPTSATTAGGGFVSTTLSCSASAGTGSETITATAGSVVASATIGITAANQTASTSLPNTGPLSPGPNPWLIGVVALAALALAGGGAYLTLGRRRVA